MVNSWFMLGAGLSFGLFMAFLILRLCERIKWSWWWIAAPLWMPPGFVYLLAFFWPTS